jgi:hypothetical protein
MTTPTPLEIADRLTPEEAWDDLLNKSDRTSPEDYPDMALISFSELEDYMNSAVRNIIKGEHNG